MSSAQTFSDLQTILSTLLDDSNTSGFWTLAERKVALNNAYFELYGRAASMGDGQGTEVTEGTLTVVSGTATIALPADLLYPHIIEIYYKESETMSYRWEATTPRDQHTPRSAISRGSKLMKYYIRGSNIVAVPTPEWSDSSNLKIVYVSMPSELSADADQPVLPQQHRELIAYYAFERLLQKEGNEMGAGAAATKARLERAFDRDMETRHKSDSRRLTGEEVEF